MKQKVLDQYHITEATKITDTSRTCSDQILTNRSNFACGSNIGIPVSNNDHCTVSVKLTLELHNRNHTEDVYGATKMVMMNSLRSAIMKYMSDPSRLQ